MQSCKSTSKQSSVNPHRGHHKIVEMEDNKVKVETVLEVGETDRGHPGEQ